MIRATTLSLLALAGLGACGGDPSGDDTGTGSNTLEVDADIEASPEFPNATNAIDFTTDFSVRVEKNSVPVATGEVTVISEGGEVPLVYDAQDERWRGTQVGYYEVYGLEVLSGDDFLRGVQIDGPDLHAFTAPVTTGSIDATVPLQIAWSRDEVADQATLETEDLDPTTIPDTGTFELAALTLKNKPDEAEQDELRLERSSRLVPTGAVAGSEVRVRIENRLELVIAPTGL